MRFVEIIGGWVNRHFSNEEAIFLVALIVAVTLVVLTLGTVLAPVLAGLVFAFLLQGLVKGLERWHVPRIVAVSFAVLLLVGALVLVSIGVLPLVWRQLEEFVAALPDFIAEVGSALAELPERYPTVFPQERVNGWIDTMSNQVANLGTTVLQALVAQVSNVFQMLIFLVLAPISVFFFLKDSDRLMAALERALPPQRRLLTRVGREMNAQIANYVRGKVVEIVIVGLASYITFVLLGLNYAALLGVVVGLSVLVPFVGAAVVTVPVAAVGLLQHGWSIELAYVMGAYAVIQAIDGNVLVPLLFSEAVNLHPIAIIVAVLAFGGIWGFWGVFFAIPLATLIKAVYNAWPSKVEEEGEQPAPEELLPSADPPEPS